MRIIAGAWRGRPLRAPADRRVRPTADRVREAWFSIVGDAVRDARVLDLFAGSGALGLEALSRGARSVTFVELGSASLKALRTNIAMLGVGDHTRVHRGDAVRFVERYDEAPYDLAFADPPYGTGQADAVATAYARRPFASLLGVEHDSAVSLVGGETRTWGNVAVTFYHPVSPEGESA